jgi:hypothetical protein
MDSTFDVRNMANEDVWFVDPVHPIDPVYRLVAAGVIKMAATLKEHEERGDHKRRRADSWETSQPQQQKPRESQYSRAGESRRDLDDPDESGGRQYGRGRGHNQRGRGYRGRQLGGHRY